MLVTVWDDAEGEPKAKRNVDLGEMMDEERFYEKRPDLNYQRMFLSLVSAGDFAGAKKYLNVGVDIDTRWGHGKRSALHTAAVENNPQAIAHLLKWGAKKDLKDFQGYTALDLAKERGNTEAISALSMDS
jgi:ankyrin repeat protein